MKPLQQVFCSSYGSVKRVKLIAIDGTDAFVRCGDRSFTTEVANLHESQKMATAGALAYRAKELREKIRKLNELHDEVKKCMAEVIESLETPTE